MKVLLINPPERKVIRSNLPSSVEELRGKNPPIGLLYVAAVLRGAGHDVSLFDAHAEDASYADAGRRAARLKPDVVGIGFNSFTYLDALEVARAVRNEWPAATIVAGGVQPFLYPSETLAQPEFDAIFAGEAEEQLVRAFEIMESKGLEGVEGGSVAGFAKKGDDLTGFAPAPLIKELDSVPMPAWDMLDHGRYSSLITHLKPVTIMITSRGCPYRCRYCALSPTGKVYRAHSPGRVVEEMKVCRGLGIRYLLLYDEVFSINRRRVMEICDLIRKEGLRIPWMARVTADTVDFEMFKAMRSAGCDTVTMGVESGSERVLEVIGRRQKIARIVEAFAEARRAGLKTIAYFMIGLPSETEADIERSLKLASSLRADHVHASIFVPYPRSEIYTSALSSGVIKDDYWREFAASPSEDFVPPFWTENFTEDELVAALFRFYRRFYLSPKRVVSSAARALRDLGVKRLGKAARAIFGRGGRRS